MENINLNLIEKVESLQKISSKQFNIYYKPNCDKTEALYYEYYRLKIEEHIKNKLLDYDVNKYYVGILSGEWSSDIMSMHYYSTEDKDETDDALEPLKDYIAIQLKLHEKKDAGSPKDLRFNEYYLDYMDDTPYICEKLKGGNN